jgi:hypothetical protein
MDDIVGPAWLYILLRGLLAKKQPTRLNRIFYIPEIAVLTVLLIYALGEMAQSIKNNPASAYEKVSV